MNEEIIFDEVVEEEPELKDKFSLNELTNTESNNKLNVPYMIINIDRYVSDNELLVRLLSGMKSYGDNKINVYAKKGDKYLLASKIDKSLSNIANILTYYNKIIINEKNEETEYSNLEEVMDKWM